MAIGIGYDIHRLAAGRKLILGGVPIDHAKGLLGHSDGDVVLHATADALLGAAGLGDIGDRFPDTDPRYKDADSRLLLAAIVEDVLVSWEIENLDVIVIAQEPKLGRTKDLIRKTMAAILKVAETAVNVKAKTMEGLGEIGEGGAIACHAAVALKRRSGDA